MSLVREYGIPTTPELQAERLRPGVSVLIPAYNEAETIGDTIGSLRAQTVPVEIVVIDDCSTDGTGELARAAGATYVVPRRVPTALGSLLVLVALMVLVHGGGAAGSAFSGS